MIQGVYSVYDSKLKAYMLPFYAATEAVAIRSFSNAANDDSTGLAKNPADYTLFFLATFNDESGEIVMRSPQINLGLAANYKGIENAP